MVKLSKQSLHLAICLLLAFIVSSTVIYAETPGDHKLASVSFFKADLVAVLQQLASECGYNVIISPDVKGTVTVQFNQTTFEEVLNYIIQANGLVYYRDKNNFYISKSGQMPSDRKNTAYFHIYYSDPKSLAESLQKMLSGAEVIMDERSRTIVVSGSKDNIAFATELVKNLDRKPKQVTIEVKIVEVSVSALHQLGAQLKTSDVETKLGLSESASEIILNLITNGHSWNGIFNALAKDGKARLVTSPSISTTEGKEASILIGDKIPTITSREEDEDANKVTYEVTYQNVGVNLIFTPWLQMDEEIGIDLKTQVSTLGNIIPIGEIDYYIIGTREVNSKIQAKIGETVFLGGLITQEERDSLQKIPFLGDLPLLGKVFQNKEKSKDEKELIITITPRWNQPVKLTSETKKP